MDNTLGTYGPSLGALIQPSIPSALSHSALPAFGVHGSTIGLPSPTTDLQGRTSIPTTTTRDSRVQYGYSRSIQEQNADTIVPRPGTPFPNGLPLNTPHRQGGTTITASRPATKAATRGSRPRIVTRAHPTEKWTTPNGTIAFDTLPGAADESTVNDNRDSSVNQYIQEPSNISRGLEDAIQEPTGLSNKVATDGFLPIIILSPHRGNLYTRRMSKSPTRSRQNGPNSEKSEGRYTYLATTENETSEHELDFNNFDIFRALLNHSSLVFEMIKYLEIDDLISLYATSREFHDLVNSRLTTVIKDQASISAPESAAIFQFKCYKHLCQFDPAKRENTEVALRVRDVPSFRWLRMITHREAIVREVINLLADEGHHLPKKTSIAIKKIWLTLDIPDNSRRIGLTHNRNFWTDSDLTLAILFFMKLDMLFTDPLDGNGHIGLRRMMMAQRGLTLLMELLRREFIQTSYDLLQASIEWECVPLRQHRGMSICGIPPSHVGRWSREGWGKGKKRLIRPDNLIIREAIRRRLNLRSRYKDMLLFGYVDPRTFESIPAEANLRLNEVGWDKTDASDDKVDEKGSQTIDQHGLDLRA